MASNKTLNTKNLEALGAERLAALLLEISTGNAAAKRRLRMELAGALSPGELAKEVRKRLATIARSRSFVDWQGVSSLAGDLEAQHQAIVDVVGKADPDEALDLLWRFMALAGPVFDRCDDSNGTVGAVFEAACADIGALALRAKRDPTGLAERAYDALMGNNGYGVFDALIASLAPALGSTGLEHLKQRMVGLSQRPVQRPSDKHREQIGWSMSGPIYADEVAEQSRASTVRLALLDIADAQGDVDAFIGQYDAATRKAPQIAAEIAQRLLGAGRADEALRTLDAAEHRKSDAVGWSDFAWDDARVVVLDALGRGDDAQLMRWNCFERALSAHHLRAYLKKLPDFDDIEAEDRALIYAEGFRYPIMALKFLIDWPALERAARLTLAATAKWDGNRYETLDPAAEALAAKYPLAATVLLRAMIDFTLSHSRSSRYQHAARHMTDCAALASVIADFGAVEDHAHYEARVHREHGRKLAFWSLVG